MRLLLLLIIFELLSLEICAASQTLAMHPDKRIKAVIACDSMNRIAVENDRITQIFGDNEAYEVLLEENTGQLFLKPTSENGKKPLSVTLITENGLTQDMSLQPEEREATTLILKNTGLATAIAMERLSDAGDGHSGLQSTSSGLALQKFGGGQLVMGHGDNSVPGFGAALGWQEQVIIAMKYLVSGSAPVMDTNSYGIKRHGLQGVEIELLGVYNLGNFKGLKLNVKNTTDVAIDILEKDFLANADLALSFAKRVLNAGESTLLYVVVR